MRARRRLYCAVGPHSNPLLERKGCRSERRNQCRCVLERIENQSNSKDIGGLKCRDPAQAERSEGPMAPPSAAMACRSPSPSVCAEERSVSRTRARRCLSEASSARPRETRAPQVARSAAKGRRQQGRLSFAYVSLAKQRKVGRPPGRDPASGKNHPNNVHTTQTKAAVPSNGTIPKPRAPSDQGHRNGQRPPHPSLGDQDK
jgi:hypothetical protein